MEHQLLLRTTAKSYTITATNSHGSASTSVSITINDQVPVISYTSPVEISNNREMTTATPTNTGGAVTSWEITPSLPTGLSFGTTNGSIWGTPENVTSNATYTVYANNSGGSGTTLNMVWTVALNMVGVDYDPLNSLCMPWRNTCAIKDNGDVYCWGRNGTDVTIRLETMHSVLGNGITMA